MTFARRIAARQTRSIFAAARRNIRAIEAVKKCSVANAGVKGKKFFIIVDPRGCATLATTAPTRGEFPSYRLHSCTE
jgi:hypothetical protein